MRTMTAYTPQDPQYQKKVSDSFSRQKFMSFLGAHLSRVEPGFCEIRLPYREELTQQHGFFHAGVVGTLADNAGGYAAFSLMHPASSVLTVEYKLNLVAPARGEEIISRARVEKYGKTLTICRVDVFAVSGGNEKLCAVSQMTLMEMKGMLDKQA